MYKCIITKESNLKSKSSIRFCALHFFCHWKRLKGKDGFKETVMFYLQDPSPQQAKSSKLPVANILTYCVLRQLSLLPSVILARWDRSSSLSS